MRIVDNRLPKLCHAKVGDLVRLPLRNSEYCEEMAPYYIVCADSSDKRLKIGRPGMMHGLYDDERPLFLVDLATGEAIKMPHLSSRVEIIRADHVQLSILRRKIKEITHED